MPIHVPSCRKRAASYSERLLTENTFVELCPSIYSLTPPKFILSRLSWRLSIHSREMFIPCMQADIS